MSKQRVWMKEEIKDAFTIYLMETREWDWSALTVEEKQCLIDKHWEIMLRELKRWLKRKVEVSSGATTEGNHWSDIFWDMLSDIPRETITGKLIWLRKEAGLPELPGIDNVAR